MDNLPTLKANKLAESYTYGNRKSVCLGILAGPNPAVLASLVALKLSQLRDQQAIGIGTAEEFIRILASQSEQVTQVVVAKNIGTVNMG